MASNEILAMNLTDLSWLIVRLTAGLMLLPHGIPKWQAGVAAFATGGLAKRGIESRMEKAYEAEATSSPSAPVS